MEVALPFELDLEVPEQALGGIPLGLGLVVKINLLILHAYRSVIRLHIYNHPKHHF